jgi:transcription antitermination factor NusG
MEHTRTEDSPIFPWYALRVRGRQERNVAASLFEKGHDVFLPQYRSRRNWSDRIKEVDLPLFPGYLFCRFDVNRRLPILVTAGVLEIVSVGRRIVPIDETEIRAIQSIVVSRLDAEPWPYLRVGQWVRIGYGPLYGLEGVLIQVKRGHRLVVSVNLLQRSVSVEVDPDWVTPIYKPVDADPEFDRVV